MTRREFHRPRRHDCVTHALPGIGDVAQNTAPALVERHRSVGGASCLSTNPSCRLRKSTAPPHPCTRGSTNLPSWGISSGGAQPTETVVPAGTEHEDVDLVVGDDGSTALMKIGDSPAAGAVEGGKVVKAVDCDSQVDISALADNFDPEPPEGLEAGQLALQRLGDLQPTGSRHWRAPRRRPRRRPPPRHPPRAEAPPAAWSWWMALLGDLAPGGVMGHYGDPSR